VWALGHAGLQRGDRVGIVGPSTVHWMMIAEAAQAAGGVLVGAYATSAAAQLEYIFAHSGARFAFVADAALAAKLVSVLPRLPALERVVVLDGDGLAGDMDSRVETLDHFLLGAPASSDEAIARLAAATATLAPDDLCSIVYTSGTTGDPKGALHSFRTIGQIAETVAPAMGYSEDDEYVVYLPLNHLAEQTYTVVLGAQLGWTLNFASSMATLLDDLPGIRPTVMFGVPRIFQKVRAAVEEGSLQPTSTGDPLAPFGLDRLRVTVCGGAPLQAELVDFFATHGVRMVNCYGMTEGNAIAAAWDRPPRGDTCGAPFPGVDVRLEPDGEVLVRSPGICLGYYRDPDATDQLLTDDGYIRTGDLGEWANGGELRLIGRKKEIIITTGGKNMSPALIENELTKCPYINQAVVIGNDRRHLVAVLEPSLEAIAGYFSARGEAIPDYASLIHHPAMVALMTVAVEEANAVLSQPEQIKRWVVLPRPLVPGDPELTPTMKIKRQAFEERHADLIDWLYDDTMGAT
jgi:long-chain acyl-CoA synthetase